MNDDLKLLKEYAESRNADAFAELAGRYAGLIYGACLRITGNEHDAEDVSQECLLELARKAGSVKRSLPGWLHSAATCRSKDAIRRAASRRRHEEQAMPRSNAAQEPTWAEVAPHIDSAIDELPDELRLPIVLHYLQGRSQAEVADELQVSQPTVSRRIDEGVGRLRDHLKKAGFVVSAAMLASLLADNCACAAPAAVLAAVAKIALAGIGESIGATSATGSLIATLKAKVIAVLVAAGVAAASGAIYYARISAPAISTGNTAASVQIGSTDSTGSPGITIATRRAAHGLVPVEPSTLRLGTHRSDCCAYWSIHLEAEGQTLEIQPQRHSLGKGFSLSTVMGGRPKVRLEYDGRGGAEGLIDGEVRVVAKVNGLSEKVIVPVTGTFFEAGVRTTAVIDASASAPGISSIIVHDDAPDNQRARLALGIFLDGNHAFFASEIERGGRVALPADADLVEASFSYIRSGFPWSRVITLLKPDQNGPELQLQLPSGQCRLDVEVEPVLERGNSVYIADGRSKAYRVVLLQQPNAYQQVVRSINLQDTNIGSPAQISMWNLPPAAYDLITIGLNAGGKQVRVGCRSVLIPSGKSRVVARAENPLVGRAILRGAVGVQDVDDGTTVVVCLRRPGAKAILWAWMEELGTPDVVALTACDPKNPRFTMNDLPEGEFTVTAYAVRGAPGAIHGVPIAQQSKVVALKADQTVDVELSLQGPASQTLKSISRP